jgi:hypothetical protein
VFNLVAKLGQQGVQLASKVFNWPARCSTGQQGVQLASKVFNWPARFSTWWPSLASQVFNLVAKLGQQGVQLGGQAWPARCCTWWPSFGSKAFTTRWSLAT